MHRFFLPIEESKGQQLTLTGDEAHHALHVLRLQPGQPVEVLNGAGEIIDCEVRSFRRDTLDLAVRGRRRFDALPCPVTLVQAIPKGKLFEDIVEKATELGVSRIVPLVSDRVISRPDADDALRKLAKWKRTAIEALKQCGSAWLPEIIQPLSLEEYLHTAPPVDFPLLASLQPGALNLHDCTTRFCQNHQSAPRSASLWIGPEGDFSPPEIARIQTGAGAFPISLGPWVLRTETAAIAGLAILNHELRARISN
jgi:16S rRNA (uracil1498-N3)-methyltransferase